MTKFDTITNVLEDFSVDIGDEAKAYPFFYSKKLFDAKWYKIFCYIGEDKYGIKYFESDEYWGGYEISNVI